MTDFLVAYRPKSQSVGTHHRAEGHNYSAPVSRPPSANTAAWTAGPIASAKATVPTPTVPPSMNPITTAVISMAARNNHEPERPRKLLLHRREIERLIGKTAERGLTLVPTRIYFKGPRAKVEIALAQGKDMRDKRRDLKARDQRREIDRALAERDR